MNSPIDQAGRRERAAPSESAAKSTRRSSSFIVQARGIGQTRIHEHCDRNHITPLPIL